MLSALFAFNVSLSVAQEANVAAQNTSVVSKVKSLFPSMSTESAIAFVKNHKLGLAIVGVVVLGGYLTLAKCPYIQSFFETEQDEEADKTFSYC
jgi:hypothetical protein